MLRAKIISTRSILDWSKSTLWPFGARESLLLLPTLFVALGFAIFSDNFGKLGIPLSLPESFGGIREFQPRLFPMEIFLAFVGALTLFTATRKRLRHLLRPFPLAVLFFVAAGMLRTWPDLRTNPLLVARNSAFVWYLTLPLMIATYPIASLRWERFIRGLYCISFIYFAVYFPYPLSMGSVGGIFWNIDYGLLFGLAFGFCGAAAAAPSFALAAIGYAIGISFLSQMQRTTLLGLGCTVIVLLLAFFFSSRHPRPDWRRIWAVLLGAALSIPAATLAKLSTATTSNAISTSLAIVQNAKPMRISESFGPGMEKFRVYMWKDAANLFVSHPLLGIGFLKPVVYRAYAGDGQFMDNDGSFEQRSQFRFEKKSPPIAGPHNSYLNALARLGIAGFAVLIFHLLALWIFFQRGYYACLFVLSWQMLYACFNVSLEGPIRSFPSLLLLGVALKCSTERIRS